MISENAAEVLEKIKGLVLRGAAEPLMLTTTAVLGDTSGHHVPTK